MAFQSPSANIIEAINISCHNIIGFSLLSCCDYHYYGGPVIPRTNRYVCPKPNIINTKNRSLLKHYYFSHGTSNSKKLSPVVCCHNNGERKYGHGIGIASFLGAKNYLVTGATGFLGKVFIEKMLRTAPNVEQIFVLVRAKDREAALHRLKIEIIDCELFKSLKELYGENYEAFMMNKLVAVPGNICESDLGMDPLTANEIADKVHVIVNSAANTNFDERYDVALSINIKGPSNLLSFAKACNNINLFLHTSTAYVNGEREGIIEETSLSMAEMGISEKQASSVPRLDIDNEMKLAANLMESVNDKEAVHQQMKVHGLQRAKIHGWPNTYSFTKAMGEMVITKMKGDIPTVILRPTIIESTYKEPFPGWIEGNRMMDPFVLSYGKGQLQGTFTDPEGFADVVPVDMVVNVAIAVMAKHGSCGKADLIVYQFGSSLANPISYGDMIECCYKYFKRYPLCDSKGNDISISRMKYFNNIDDFSSYISNEIAKKNGLTEPATLDPDLYAKLQMLCKKQARHFIEIAKVYEPYTFYKGRFDVGNTQKLMEEMSNEEISMVWFDLRSINWEKYICSIHIPGLRKHVLKSK